MTTTPLTRVFVVGHIVAAPILGLIACKSVTVDGPVVSLALHGRVTDSAGVPIAGAVVTAAGAPGPQCVAQGAQGVATTDTTGTYTVVDVFFSARDYVGCVRLVVTPPPGSSLAPRTVDSTGVRFRTSPQPPDSVRIDVVLRAGA